MKHVTQIFSRKALSIICALAIVLSGVSVGFSALAETPAAAAQYIVDADKSPAIPMFAGTKIDLNNVGVLFAGDETATPGSEITWTLGGDYGQNLILGDDKSLTAFLKGNEYKITATAGEKEAVLWVVVANEGDSSWDIYNFDFDKYSAEMQLDKLTFEADGGYRFKNYSYSGKAIYRTGTFKYNGAAFNQNSIPDAVKPIEGWTAWVKGYMNANQNGASNYIEIPFLMPYKHTGETGNLWLNRAVSSGVMPFDNPYMTGALGLDNDNQLIHSVSNGLAQMKGFYVLDNEVVNAFLDYTVTADMDMTTLTGYDGVFAAAGYNGVFGRLQTDAAGNPSTTVLQNYTSSNFININWGNVFAETTARTDIANVLFGVNIYAPVAGNQYHRGASVGKIEVNKNAQHLIVTDVAGCDAKDYIGEKYALTNSGGASISVDNWDYIKSKGYISEGKSTAGANVVMSVKYAGSTATVFSPADTTESFSFDNVPTLKGKVGIWAGNITRSDSNGNVAKLNGAEATGNWINLHNFKVSLNNDITASNDGSEYPVYEKYYFQPVVDANISESYTDLAKFEIYFSNLTDAIDYLDGEGGKVWVKGELIAAGYKLEGTIENRKPIIIAGYDDNNANGKITIYEDYNPKQYSDTGRNWTKGDITFQNITLDNTSGSNGYGSDAGFGSGGNTITFGENIVTGNKKIVVGAYPAPDAKDLNINIKSGDYALVGSTVNGWYDAFDTPVNMNATINISGGTVDALYTSVGSNKGGSKAYVTINGDVKYNITGGTVNTLNLLTQGYGSDVFVQGDTIIRISGGTINKPIAFQYGQSNQDARVLRTTNHVPPLRSNIALIIDAAKTSKAVIGASGGIANSAFVQNAENKYNIAIINNYGVNANVKFDTTQTYQDLERYSYEAVNDKGETVTKYGVRPVEGAVTKNILDRFDYKLTVTNGEAQPIFVREDANDPTSSYLKGFTIVPNEPGAIPAINGVALVPTGEKWEGKDLYDLSAYKSDKEDVSDDAVITAIAFIDTRTPVVSTDDTFIPDVELYNKVSTINEAINSLGAEGGKIYVKGEYTITDMVAEFAASANVIDGKNLVIAGFGDTAEGGTLNLGTASTGINLSGDWLHCALTFENLTMNRAKQRSENGGFNSNNQILTFGEGLVTNFIDMTIGQVMENKTSNIVINSGSYSHLSTSGVNTTRINGNYNLTINGGYFDISDWEAHLMGPYDNGRHDDEATKVSAGKSTYINGDITYNINGGEFEANDKGFVKLSTQGRGYAYFANYGTTRVNVSGSNLTMVEIHPGYMNSTEDFNGKRVVKYNNMVVRADYRYTDVAINSQLIAVDKNAENNGKKYIAIANYANLDWHITNQQYGLDYILNVYDGEADAVFSGEGAAAQFVGFTITAGEGNEGKLVVVNGTDIIEAVDGIYDLSAYEDKGLTKIEFKAAEELEDTKEVVTDSSVIAGYINGLVPEKEGYLFGGFIGENGKALKADEIANAESLTVKFIPKAVLDIGWQIRQEGNTVDLRLISTVDSLEYSAVTFIVKVAGRDDMVLTSKKVYTKIAGYKDGENVQYAPTAFSAASEYFMTHVITGIPVGFHGTDFTVTANLLTKDGKTITGDAIEFQIKNHDDYTAIVE